MTGVLAPEVVRARAERDGIVPPGDDLRDLRFFRNGKEGDRLWWRGAWWTYADGDWWKERPAPRLSEEEMRRAAVVGEAARKKHDAAPDWSEFVALWGEQGAIRNARGKIVGYRYPKYADPEKQRMVNMQVLELWSRHTRVSTDLGLEESARHAPVTLLDRDTGRKVTTHPATAERRAKKSGMVEAPKRLRRKSGGSA